MSAHAETTFKLVEQSPLQGVSLVDELRGGGYVLYLRHAITEHIKIDRTKFQFDDCTTQRNLDDAGREQAREIGVAFKTLAVPVGKVISSPYCRCKDTGQLAFNKREINNNLHYSIGVTEEEKILLRDQLRDMLLTKPQPGTNTVLISHTANLKDAVGVWPKPEGVIAIFKILATGELGYFGLVLPEEWPRLVELVQK